MTLSDVFISYRRTDVEFVKQLDVAFKTDGREVWLDFEDIPPAATSFSDEIKQGIEGASAFVAVLSPDYLRSTYCVDLELGYAVKLNKKVIPIVFRKFDGEDVAVPESIQSINWVYFTPHAGQSNTFEEAFPRLLQGLDADYAHAKEHTRLLLRAQEWDSFQRNNSYLLRGQELHSAEAWMTQGVNKLPRPLDLHADYITTGRHVAVRRARNWLTMTLVGLAVTVLLAVAAIVLGLEANNQRGIAEGNYATASFERDRADANAATASFNADLAATNEAIAEVNADLARSLLWANVALQVYQGGDYLQAMALALAANGIADPSVEAQQALRQIAYAPGIVQVFGGDLDTQESVSAAVPNGNAPVGDAAAYTLSHSGDDYVIRDGDGTATLWLRAYPGSSTSPDGQYVVDSEIGIWAVRDAASGDVVTVLSNVSPEVFEATFSPGGDYVITRTGELSLQGYREYAVYERTTGRLAAQFANAAGRGMWLIGVSDDGRQLLFDERLSDLPQSYSLWDITNGQLAGQYKGFSGDGALFVSAGAEGNRLVVTHILLGNGASDAYVFDLDSGAELLSLTWEDIDARSDQTQILAWGESGLLALLPTADGSGAVSLVRYDLDSGDATVLLAAPPDGVRALSPDGALGFSSACVQWDANSNCTQANHGLWRTADGSTVTEWASAEELSGIFSADGTRLVLTGLETDVVVLDTASGQEVGRVAAQAGSYLYAISADASTVIYTPTQGGLVLVDVSSGNTVRTLLGLGGSAVSAAFSADGRYVAAGNREGRAVVWDIASGSMLWHFNQLGNQTTVAFRPGHDQLITSAIGGATTLWQLDTLDELMAWAQANRASRDFSCEERAQYLIEPLCE